MQIDLHKQYVEQGCILVPGLLTPAQCARMRVICEYTLCQWRVKSPEDGRAHITEPDNMAMRHLNHPGYFTDRKEWLVELLDLAADPRVLDVVREVFKDDVMFRCTSLFINPLEMTREGNWHRDSQFGTPDEVKERAFIEKEAARNLRDRRPQNMQLQIALIPSEDSEFVPGSHLRWDTPEEYYIRLADGQKHNGSNLMPGAVRNHQEPGDAAAFDSFGLHRGRYYIDKARRTLMLTYNAVSCEQERDYFSDQPWCLEPGYLDGTKPETRRFFERYIDNFRDYWLRERK